MVTLLHAAARRAEKPFDQRRKREGSNSSGQHRQPRGFKKVCAKTEREICRGLDFPLLEDKNHKVIDRYGILNPDGKGWPHPATYLIDQRGIVRWKFIETDYKKRPINEQILAALREIR